LPDPAAAAALQTGGVDIWEVPDVDLLPLIRRNRNLKLELVHETGFCQLLRPNHLYPPFDDPMARRAVLGAVDQARFMMAAVGTDTSLWRAPCGFFPPSSPYGSQAGLDEFGSGRADANAALKGAKAVLIVAADVPILKAISDVALETLRRLGMDVDYQAMDGATFVRRRASTRPPGQGGWNVFCGGPTGADLFDPGVHQPLRATGESAWPGWPSSRKLEQLRDAWLDASADPERERLAAAIQMQAFEDVPYVPLGVHYSPSAYRADIAGVLTGFPMFWNLRRV
jgi:peptide/nickel transport system substrate-binding protein